MTSDNGLAKLTMPNGTIVMVPTDSANYRAMTSTGLLASGNMPAGSAAASRLVFASDGGMQRPGFQGNLTTEALLGTGCTDADHMVCDRSRPVQGAVTIQNHEIFQIDYPVIGVIGQIRAVTETLFSRGRSVAFSQAMVSAPPDFIAEFALNDPLFPWNNEIFPESMFARIDWSVQALNWQAFNMNIKTTGWFGLNGQRLDRELTIRVTSSNSGSVYIPWAQRTAPPMAMAMNQIALPLPLDEGGAYQSKIEILQIPGTILPSFSAQVSFGTAFSPQAAAFAQLIGLYGNKPQAVLPASTPLM